MATRRVKIQDSGEALALLGEQDSLLRRFESEFSVELVVRQDPRSPELSLSIRGTPARVTRAVRAVQERLGAIRGGKGQAPAARRDAEEFPTLPDDGIIRSAHGKVIRPKTRNQESYVAAILSHDLVFGIGPAGTGKTYLAVACALRVLQRQTVNRIILSRPVVEAGERLGFLPGDLLEKVHPYLRPLYDAFYSFVGPQRFRSLRESEVIEVVPLAYMRGRTFEDAFILLDEAQNTTPEQMKMFLTRMGNGSRAVVTGDITQTDLEAKATSGLIRIMDVLKDMEGVAFRRLSEEDVVRHPLVRKIIQAYERWEQKR